MNKAIQQNRSMHIEHMKNPEAWAFLGDGVARCPVKRSQGAAFWIEGSFGRATTGVLVSDMTRLENGEFKLGFLEGENVFYPSDPRDVELALSRPVTAEQLFEDAWRVD